MIVGKFKQLIEPIQMWLLGNGRCVGCGKEITKSAKVSKKNAAEDILTCECSRVYIFDKKRATYRRALMSDLS